MVNGSRPEGDTEPNSTSARAWPPCSPGYQSSSRPGTSWCQGWLRMAPPPISTTTVRRLAAATARISCTWGAGSCRSVRSPAAKAPRNGGEAWLVSQAIRPVKRRHSGRSRGHSCKGSSQSGGGINASTGAMSPGWMCSPSSCQSSPATTTAASQPAARAAAALGSRPSWWRIGRSGRAACRPCSGVTTAPAGGRVSEEPRSPRFTAAASGPISASEPRSPSGSTGGLPPSGGSLRSSTIACRAASRASSRCSRQRRRVRG